MKKGENGNFYCLICNITIPEEQTYEHCHRENHESKILLADEETLHRWHNDTDARNKCDICHGWMRHKPTVKTPLERNNPPQAGICIPCAKKHNIAVRSMHDYYKQKLNIKDGK